MMDDATARFAEVRPHLLGLAYRMLGEMSGAEDIVQEAWLRWHSQDTHVIRDARAWLSAVTIRLSLDTLRSARAKRETYVGPWLPEPLMPDDMRTLSATDPASHAELASDLSLALLHTMERLSPEERAALILHDAFDCEYAEIAAMLDKTEAACRKLVSRARERVKSDRPRYTISRQQHEQMLARFAQAVTTGNTTELGALFADDVVFYSDGGGHVSAARNPVFGIDRVTRLIAGLWRKFYGLAPVRLTTTEINGQPSILITGGDQVISTMTIECEDGRITALYVMRNPEKLTRILRAVTTPPFPGSSASV